MAKTQTSKLTVRKINTTAGPRYIIGFMDKGRFVPSPRFSGREYKKKSSALRAIGQ